jgi:predicted AAA+ superfamily ATPase
MKRSAMKDLLNWKENENRKPLLIRGSRQVGKTYLMKHFGQAQYEQVVYINFENNQTIKLLFDLDYNVERIIKALEIFSGKKISFKNTLLIFDEIQEVPRALTALKYFYENAPEYQIICAGSLLGVALHEDISFPVGKIEFLDLYPLSFFEFLNAMGKESYVEIIKSGDFDFIQTFKNELTQLLKQYYYVGGMPEAVVSFVKNQSFEEVRKIQQNILDSYELDFSKHVPSGITPRLRMLFNSIPSQLSKENKKFIYGLIKEGSRAKQYEVALMWLIDCSLIHKVSRVNKNNLPLKAYEDLKAFKLFILDVGLLACMTRLNLKTLLEANNLFVEFKGSLTEQFVLQQLKTLKEFDIYYWTNEKGSAEIDFLLDNGSSIIPVEVKAETNLRSKSLKVYNDKFSPKHCVRLSLASFKKEESLINLPLWAVEVLPQLLN